VGQVAVPTTQFQKALDLKQLKLTAQPVDGLTDPAARAAGVKM